MVGMLKQGKSVDVCVLRKYGSVVVLIFGPPYALHLSCPCLVVAVELGLCSLPLVFILVNHLVSVLMALGSAMVGVLFVCEQQANDIKNSTIFLNMEVFSN